MSIRVVGLNLSHDSSVCVVEDGRVVTALALERVTRVKRGVVAAHQYAPAMAALVHDVLSSCGLSPDDVDHWIATSTESRDNADEEALADCLGLLVPPEKRLSLPHPGHHLAHASAAFYTSGFDEAAALVIDAYGSRTSLGRERESAFHFTTTTSPTTLWRYERDDARIAGRICDGVMRIPMHLSGIGEIYRVVTLALGFNESGTTYDDAGKTMGLAAYSAPLSDQDLFISVEGGTVSFGNAAGTLIELGLAIAREDGLELKARPRDEPPSTFHQQIAAQLQREFEQACLHLADDALSASGSRRLVLSGGCFLNSVLNTRIHHETGVEQMFVFPAATDDGNAVGAALYAYNVLVPTHTRSRRRIVAMTDAFLGPARRLDTIADTAHRWGLYAAPSSAQRAADAIARGEIVAVFQPRSEFGPRALGARSILCHPGIAGMKDRLNSRVKFREAFRPFAASVLAEQAPAWFGPGCDSPFMLRVCTVRTDKQRLISEVVHVDGTCRIQTVSTDLPGLLRELLEVFDARTGIPMVLNTSFNVRGQPIVEYPEQALDCLFGSRIDRLFIGDYEIAAPEHALLRPIALSRHAEQRPVDAPARALLDYADGVRTVADIAGLLTIDVDELINTALVLRLRGLLGWAAVPEIPVPRMPLPQYEPLTGTHR